MIARSAYNIGEKVGIIPKIDDKPPGGDDKPPKGPPGPPGPPSGGLRFWKKAKMQPIPIPVKK